MARILYNNSSNLHFADNETPAYLQAVTAQRFADGRGFFVTSTGNDNDGNVSTTSYWFHPTIPIQFIYDGADQPVTLDDEKLNWFVFMARTDLGIMLSGVDGHPYQFDTRLAEEDAD